MLPRVYEDLLTSEVTALVEDRIYRHGEAPQGTQAPYVTWFVVTGLPENALGESPRVDQYLVQIDCWSDNDGSGDEGVEMLAEAVRDSVEAAGHYMNAVVANNRDPETKRFRLGMTFTYWEDRPS